MFVLSIRNYIWLLVTEMKYNSALNIEDILFFYHVKKSKGRLPRAGGVVPSSLVHGFHPQGQKMATGTPAFTSILQIVGKTKWCMLPISTLRIFPGTST